MDKIAEIEIDTRGAIAAILKEIRQTGIIEKELLSAMGGIYRLSNLELAPRRWGRENLRKLYRLWLKQGLRPERFLDLLLVNEYRK